MKILFVASGNGFSGISPIVDNQRNSLIKAGIEVEVFPIVGKGIIAYVASIFKLKKFLIKNHYDLIHAHYSLSAFVAACAGSYPLVVSLMGSDITMGWLYKFFIGLCSRLYWDAVIVKSEQMKIDSKLTKALVIPNGVDFIRFYPADKKVAQARLGFDSSLKHILFAANPNRKVKNFSLAQNALSLLDRSDVVLHYLINVPNEEIVWHYSASDIILLTSLREGSPNVIKEAMACDKPIVCTKVGDVETVIGKTKNCFICNFNAVEIAESLDYLLTHGISETNGRDNILELNEVNIAHKIIHVYQSILNS